MVGTVILVILFILCVLLLLPLRVSAFFREGKWGIRVSYVFFPIFHKESQEKPKPETPPKPGDPLPEDSPAPEKPAPEPEPPQKPKPPPAAAEAAPKPEAVAESVKPQPESAKEPESESDAKPEHPEASAPVPDSKKKKKHEEKAAADEADEADKADPEKPEKPKKRGFFQRIKPHSVSDAVGLAKDALAALSPALKFLTRHLHFRHIKLYLAVASDDPANTATLYGKICAAAYNLLAALQCWVDIETDEFRILADFYHEKITFRASLELRVSPMTAILLLLILGIKFLWRTLCRFRREDKEAKRREKESAPVPLAQS